MTLSLGFAVPFAFIQAPTTTTTTVAHCDEDQPCWDCATMGNLICGPVTR